MKTGVQAVLKGLKILDSGFRRNDGKKTQADFFTPSDSSLFFCGFRGPCPAFEFFYFPAKMNEVFLFFFGAHLDQSRPELVDFILHLLVGGGFSRDGFLLFRRLFPAGLGFSSFFSSFGSSTFFSSFCSSIRSSLSVETYLKIMTSIQDFYLIWRGLSI